MTRTIDLDHLDVVQLEEFAHVLRLEADRRRRIVPRGHDGSIRPFTIGWYRRNSEPPRPPAPAPTMTPAAIERLMAGLVADGWPEDVMVEAVVALAVETGTTSDTAEQASGRGLANGRQRRAVKRAA